MNIQNFRVQCRTLSKNIAQRDSFDKLYDGSAQLCAFDAREGLRQIATAGEFQMGKMNLFAVTALIRAGVGAWTAQRRNRLPDRPGD
jgi:hypothetical protein